MHMSFEPGDGSFHVVLSEHEPVPAEWNIPPAEIWREVAADSQAGGYVIVKKLGEVLP